MRPGTPGFVHHRLKEAREARSMTALSLAEIVGVTTAAISQYENGHQSPSPDVMRRISSALNVPLHRFLMPVRRRDTGVLYFRSLSSATKRARLRAIRRYEWLRELCDYIQRFVRFRPANFPAFDVPADPAKLSVDDVEECASRTREHFKLNGSPVGNMIELLENNGGITCMFDFEAATLDAFSEWDESGRPFFVLSSEKQSAVRSRFDAAHELAHMVLHRNVPSAVANRNDCFALMEDQAHRFAGAFLLPAREFSEALYAPSLDAMRALKPLWRVSISAMVMRSFDLGLIDDNQRKKLFANIARRKWRTREPYDDQLERERPKYLQRCIEVLLDRGIVGPRDLTATTGIPVNDAERLLGLRRGTLATDQMSIDMVSDVPPDAQPEDDEPRIIQFRQAQ